MAQLEEIAERQLRSQIEELSQLADALDAEGIVAKFQELVPTYQPNRAFITETDMKSGSEIIQFPAETKTTRASRR